MITSLIAFQWFSAAFFLLPIVMPYIMPTFYDDQFRKHPNDPESLKRYSYRESGYRVPPPWIFVPIWWIVGMANGAVAILYWQDPSLTHPDRADAVFGLLYAIPFLQIAANYLFFKPVSFIGAAILCWLILFDVAGLWWFIIWSGNTMPAIMGILSIPSLWAILAAGYTTYWASIFPIDEAVRHAHRKLIALNQLVDRQMRENEASESSQTISVPTQQKLPAGVTNRVMSSHIMAKIE